MNFKDEAVVLVLQTFSSISLDLSKLVVLVRDGDQT